MVAIPRGWSISPRLLAMWQIDVDHTLEIWPHSRTPEGRIRWQYRLCRKRRVIFSASDISSGVGAQLTTEELISAARTVLSYATLRDGDTDPEFFEGYTKTQLAWRDQHAECLSIYTDETVCGYCGDDHLSPGCPSL